MYSCRPEMHTQYRDIYVRTGGGGGKREMGNKMEIQVRAAAIPDVNALRNWYGSSPCSSLATENQKRLRMKPSLCSASPRMAGLSSSLKKKRVF